MTPEQVELVKSTWGKLAPSADQIAVLFYGRLFEIAPEVEPLFSSDMNEQGILLMKKLNQVVLRLPAIDATIPFLPHRAARPLECRVSPQHYDSVGEALLWTFEQGLGEEGFTSDVMDAWSAAYKELTAEQKNVAAA